MAIEDFTTYTEVDTQGWLTVASNKIEGTDVNRNVDAYVYKDYTADFFNALDILFEIQIEDTSELEARGGPAISDTIGSVNDFASTDISIAARVLTAGPAYQIELARGNYLAKDTFTGAANTLYYCTLSRAAGNDTVTLKIYSDSPRTNLLDTLTVAGFGVAKWRYSYGFVNVNSGPTNRAFDGFVQDMDLQTGWTGGNVIGVANASIAKINGVAMAAIGKVNGVA